jgi:hypothetical protein
VHTRVDFGLGPRPADNRRMAILSKLHDNAPSNRATKAIPMAGKLMIAFVVLMLLLFAYSIWINPS